MALRLVSFGIFWFFLTLSVESSIIPITDVIFEHRLYLPSVGFVLAVAAGFQLVARRLSPRLLLAVSAVLVLVLTGATLARNRVWQSDESIWRDTLVKSPRKSRPHMSLGAWLDSQGRSGEAEAHYSELLAYNPQDALGYNQRGTLYFRQERLSQALEDFRRAASIQPERVEFRENLGQTLAALRRFDEAEKELRQATGLAPRRADTHICLANLYYVSGRHRESEQEYLNAISLEPRRALPYHNLCLLYLDQGRLSDADDLIYRARTLMPGDPILSNAERLLLKAQEQAQRIQHTPHRKD